MTTTKRTLKVLFISALALSLTTGSALAKPKATKPKKKRTATTRVQPQTPSGTRNFSCIGAGTQKVTERIVTGTVSSKVMVTNVTVTQTTRLLNNTLVAQPVVVLVSPNPKVEQDPITELLVFRLNEVREATAADVDQTLTLYQLNFKPVLPKGPEFEAGLYFYTLVGAAGPAANEYRWNTVASLSSGGAYGMKCTYV